MAPRTIPPRVTRKQLRLSVTDEAFTEIGKYARLLNMSTAKAAEFLICVGATAIDAGALERNVDDNDALR